MEKLIMEKRESLQSPFQGDGRELRKLFDPRFVLGKEGLNGVSEDYLSEVAGDVRKYVYSKIQGNKIRGKIESNNGQFQIEGQAVDVMRKTGGAIASLIAYPDIVQLPQTKNERQALGRAFTRSAMEYHSELDVIAPVCPDYGKGDDFYKSIGRGISPEARAAIDGAKVLSASFSDFITPFIHIVVADTEDDIEEVINNTSSGEVTIYKDNCEASVQAIRDEVKHLPHVTVLTFSQMFKTSFRVLQNLGEEKLRELMEKDEHVYGVITKIAEQRMARHSQILSRPEQACELTIRYMAQYMSLGEHIRFREEPHILMNYPTPNRAFYNAAHNIHPDLKLTSESHVIPVLGTFAKR